MDRDVQKMIFGNRKRTLVDQTVSIKPSDVEVHSGCTPDHCAILKELLFPLRAHLTSYAGILIGSRLQGLVATENLRTFPNVEGKNLHGAVVNDLRLPDRFCPTAAKRCGYLAPQTERNGSRRRRPGVHGTATISRMNAFMRWFIYRGMRSGIENPVSQAPSPFTWTRNPSRRAGY